MQIFTREMLQKYMEKDWILDMLVECEHEKDKNVRTHKWLKCMDNKRMIYSIVYGDFLNKKNKKQRILDVGGGYTSLTKKMLSNSDYYLLDFMAHGGQEVIDELQQNKEFWINEDWMKYDIDNSYYDVIVANDIFPDVDQRMEMFIEKYLPHCREMRLVITFYNSPKWYLTQRTDDTELLTFLSWDGEITKLKLEKYEEYFIDTILEDLDILPDIKESIFFNGRQVVYIKLKGGMQ